MPRERAVRRVLDQYDTPPWQVDALVNYVPAIAGGVWECCAGDGSLLTQLMTQRPELGPVLTIDIDPSKLPMVVGDATDPALWASLIELHGRPDWVVTNPPFSDAFTVLQCALDAAQVGVAMLARVSFVEPTRGRGPWLLDHPHDQRIVLERHSYTGNRRSDMATTEWLIYVKDWRILTPPFGVSAYGYRPR